MVDDSSSGHGRFVCKRSDEGLEEKYRSVYRSSSCLLFLISKLTDFSFQSQEFDRIVVAAGGDERERDL
jgi:hypothetical protein